MAQTRYNQIMRTFAARLRTAREAAGYPSAQRFAGVLGIEPHTYRKYERGKSEPNFETLMRICEMLNVEVGYLLPRSIPPGPPRAQRGSDGQKEAA